MGKWHLPVEDMRAFIMIIRRIARLLWTLMLDLEDGFDESMQVGTAEVRLKYRLKYS